MQKIMILAGLLVLLMGIPAVAAEDPLMKGAQGALDTFTEGCQQELSTICKDVVPGEGRILACLFAFSDQVTPRCEYAVYDSISQLDRTLSKVSYAIGECKDELKSQCADIKPGEGRLLDCLSKEETKVSSRCNNALKETGLKK